jgi:hypothetical protein
MLLSKSPPLFAFACRCGLRRKTPQHAKQNGGDADILPGLTTLL